jgi:hypothetical protein
LQAPALRCNQAMGPEELLQRYRNKYCSSRRERGLGERFPAMRVMQCPVPGARLDEKIGSTVADTHGDFAAMVAQVLPDGRSSLYDMILGR